jgi:hypothetical protein
MVDMGDNAEIPDQFVRHSVVVPWFFDFRSEKSIKYMSCGGVKVGEDVLVFSGVGGGRPTASSPSPHFVAGIPLLYKTIAAISRFGKHPPNQDTVNGFVTHPVRCAAIAAGNNYFKSKTRGTLPEGPAQDARTFPVSGKVRRPCRRDEVKRIKQKSGLHRSAKKLDDFFCKI